jgi:FMN-dependent NADH-azoreductase
MKSLLQLHSSLFADNSVSRQISDKLVAQLRENKEVNQVITRNLAEAAIPHLDATWITALTTAAEERTAEQQQMVDYSDKLIAEIQTADVVVIGAPMYNFGVPTVLKAWFDHIARAGVTFTYTDKGPEGLLTGKVAYVVTTRGGIHKDASTDTQVPFLKNILGFVGIQDVHIIYAEGLNMGEEQREKGFAEAKQAIEKLVA